MMKIKKTRYRRCGANEVHDAHGTLQILWLLLALLLPTCATAQIEIDGNVYGGGNIGEVDGNTKVTVRAGDLNHVFGGARMANVSGSALVNIDGEYASNYIIINKLYGGNDISGTVGLKPSLKTLPDDYIYIYLPVPKGTTLTSGTKYYTSSDGKGEFTSGGTEVSDGGNYFEKVELLKQAGENHIDNSWDAYVHLSTKTETVDGKEVPAADAMPVYIGQLFGGGNGDYDYDSETTTVNEEEVTTYIAKEGDVEVASSTTPFNVPELKKAYLEILGGSIVYAYGGGNNATVTEHTVICVDNPSEVVSSIKVKEGVLDNTGTELLTQERFKNEMGINIGVSKPSSDEFQIGRLFGGNNKADMSIMPEWNLKRGKIRNLYSGGNEGRMTSSKGLLLEIMADSKIVVDNVFGGCRKADVDPHDHVNGGRMGNVANLGGEYKFPDNLAARVLIRGGDINNVYGGNDVSGKVWFGNAVGIYTSIRGDVYGGGNGSYPYTDNKDLKGHDIYSDFYYDVNALLGLASNTTITGSNSAAALNLFRPNAEQVSIRIWGKDADHPTIIHGSIYCGGNSATLKSEPTHAQLSNYPLVELKVGSHVIADNVFLGNNGEQMVTSYNPATESDPEDVTKKILNMYAGSVDVHDFSQMDLTNADQMKTYMEGAAMPLKPRVVFDDLSNGDPANYVDYSTYIGSFFCGGNRGSMTVPGKTSLNFNRKLIIYNKVVGGCNNAFIPATDYNAEYDGGILGLGDAETDQTLQGSSPAADYSGPISDRLELNFDGLKIQPKRWKKDGDDYVLTDYGYPQLEWNTINAAGVEVPPLTAGTDAHPEYRLKGGDIYGGCYEGGHVNGNVVINLNKTIHDRKESDGVPENHVLFDKVEEKEGEAILYDHDTDYHILKRHTGVILDEQGMDVLGKALNVFGGGYGKNSEIWGSTTVNLNAGYTFQIFGGGLSGGIGRGVRDSGGNLQYTYDERYSTTINLKGDSAGVYRGHPNDYDNMAASEFIYGGGFVGPIAGNTTINLGNGRVFNTFAGSCNADILGHTETYIGRQPDGEGGYIEGFPWVRDHLYGGNDLGGRILGSKDFTSRVNEEALSKVHSTDTDGDGKRDVLQATTYVEYIQGRVVNIFGGCYGDYDYEDEHYKDYFYTCNRDEDGNVVSYTDDGSNASNVGTSKDGYTKPRLNNAFVNFKPNTHDRNSVARIFGAGQGHPMDSDRDMMQNRSYVLIDAPQNTTKFTGMEVFGAGGWSGLGMIDDTESAYAEDKDKYSAIIDLVHGQVAAAYGGSFSEGITRRTQVNVPDGSTIKIGSIFGGAYGEETLHPCDVYEANVEYHSSTAGLIYNPEREEKETDSNGDEITVKKGDQRYKGAIYGGNNSERRTIYGKVNINVPVYQNHYKYGMTLATIYGAGCGSQTWSEYTEVNLESGAKVYEVYGGGEAGRVVNAESIQALMNNPESVASTGVTTVNDPRWYSAWKLGAGYDPASLKTEFSSGTISSYTGNTKTNLDNEIARTAEMDDRSTKTYKYNTNVIIKEGAYVDNYAYGGGLGKESVSGSGDVYGTTYIALLGGRVKKDLYAAGTMGGVFNTFENKNSTTFIASANAFIQGGTARNVYGGGWKGSVGKHTGASVTVNGKTQTYIFAGSTTDDILGETHVVIGKAAGTSFIDGIPAIERNAYGGGEGGAVFGTTNLTLQNGFIGYKRFTKAPNSQGMEWAEGIPYIQIQNGSDYDYYYEKLNDETWNASQSDTWSPKDSLNRLRDSGCLFGGGYIDNSSVDITNVKMYGGHVRNAIFGGGEIAAVGRGLIEVSGEKNSVRTLHDIYKAGKTNVELFNGHVHRNVFGGGRGYNNVGGVGTLYSDGFVFGQTEAHVHGGEVGTLEGVANEDGNVFGGGDIGYVYSAYDDGGTLRFGKKSGTRWDDGDEGYYYQAASRDPEITNDFVLDDSEKIPTEDCKVLIEPQCRVKEAVTINSHDYAAGDYVDISDLNTLKNKAGDNVRWAKLDDAGIIIHNAVFAGGNTSSGSDKAYANATSVFGNATASIHDVYHRDLITIGTGRTGGLYGDGNLTFVDGYRGLNITNYGTDYYNISPTVSYDYYENNLTERERAYYELRYKCIEECTDDKGKKYRPETETTSASTISLDDFKALFANQSGMFDENGEPNSDFWEFNGVCSRYAGRLMNTIQRADFCGVFGSRMVMMGAQDRVPSVADYTNYTINRVREVSLNKKQFSEYSAVETDANNTLHGNYFGIYNIVNHLGALTSDVHFDDVRTTKADVTTNTQFKPNNDTETYYDWKEVNWNKNTRNNASSYNQVALASGVYLELTTDNPAKTTGTGVNQKDWGYITGIVELDLINVQPGMGGGFVYAKNVHGTPFYSRLKHVTLTQLNADAVSRKDYTYANSNDYSVDEEQKEWETSGNFVHSSLTIIDDCYNIGGRYMNPGRVPAHYWFIKGDVYVYDQYISAYTGAPNAYSEVVDIPLTITAASHGTMKLLDVQPNYYAFYRSTGVKLTDSEDDKLEINNVTYHLNDPISYWDYHLMTSSQQALFVPMTYVAIKDCRIGSEAYPKDTLLSPTEYDAMKESQTYIEATGLTVGETSVTGFYTKTGNDFTEITDKDAKAASGTVYYKQVPFTEVFRSSNNVSHDTGYILTYQVNNPSVWGEWYSKIDGSSDKILEGVYEALGSDGKATYTDGPTYRLKDSETSSVFGQRDYKVSNIIDENTYYTYEGKADDLVNYPGIKTHLTGDGVPTQATFERAYIVTSYVETTKTDGTPQNLYPGVAVVRSDYYNNSDPGHVIDNWTAMASHVAEAYVCTGTIQLSETQYIYATTKMTADEKAAYIEAYPSLADLIDDGIVPAYYCTKDGRYGGKYYETGTNYRAIEAWSSLSAEDREHFTFNYDALDLLIDGTYGGVEGEKYQYDSEAKTLAGANGNLAHYSLATSVDYTATYTGDVNLSYTKDDGTETDTNTDPELTRTEFERLPNEQRYYSRINVTEERTTYYVVCKSFALGNSPYAVGQTIDSDTYNNLGEYKSDNYVTPLTFTEAGHYYYCREKYTPTTAITALAVDGAVSYTSGDVPVGVVIAGGDKESPTAGTYWSLPNQQKNFTIHGEAPVETSTLFVTRNSDIDDLSKERIITAIYQYDYEVSDTDGNIIPYSERHVLNIHLNFKSGIPTIEDITSPRIVIPGTNVGMKEPVVTPGAYEITGGGWELFERIGDAESHTNGIAFTPNADPLYWYQNGYYLEYYALTYLGKTYSNAVQVSVANYHDMKKVMDDKKHHYYVDHKNVDRYPKIYINDYSDSDENGLDMFKNFFDLSLLTSSDVNTDANGLITTIKGTEPAVDSPFKGHALLNNRVTQGQQLEFILHSNISHSGGWTPIGSEERCFGGNLHGDGYYISGLDKSLFGSLCGNVYNLGVRGSFTGAGVADAGDGFVENCWIATSRTDTTKTKKPVFEPTNESGFRIVNCYYLEDAGATNPYTNHSGTYGIPTKKPEKSFYNGEVAYDLNYFYLTKRYYDNNTEWTAETKTPYSYYSVNKDDGKLVLHNTEKENSGYYPSQFVFYPLEESDPTKKVYGYVENRYADGDFIYSEGSIPESIDERLDLTTRKYYPIYPDDYMFFGQTLTYGWGIQSHQNVPSHLNKSGGRLTISESSNRVYRAPAYFQNSTMDMAHFNPAAYLVAHSKPLSETDFDWKDAYPRLTAIDFAGHNDLLLGASSYKIGVNDGCFFSPLLDDDGLFLIDTQDQTQNLLVYAPGSTANAQTFDVLTDYFKDPPYASYYQDATNKRNVLSAPASDIHGHLVQSNLVTNCDHLLVDKQDFDCPLSYTFGLGNRMWYQRTPDNYVGHLKNNDGSYRTDAGWESISLPFEAELITTNQKGEITHFYEGSPTAKNSDAKIGHEYWLREYRDISGLPGDATAEKKAEALFTYPKTITGADAEVKVVTNTFLWDYYYNADGKHSHLDANNDIYQTYYNSSRTLAGYPLLTKAKPYIIGFPGQRFYEFDLSGTFEAKTTASPTPDKLGRQVITFASKASEEDKPYSIAVSDNEKAGVTFNGYTFKPSYLNQSLEAGTNNYVLAANGASYSKVPAASTPPVADTPVAAFRPFFTKSAGGARGYDVILFSNEIGELPEPYEDRESEDPGTLLFTAGTHKIIVSSSLRREADVQIFNTAGLNVATFTIQPGETIETPINSAGVYIVRAAHGQYMKKLAVR